jgi:urease accessory protein UreE
MTTAADTSARLRESFDRDEDLLTQLRRVEHWRRLVAARLDLAVAAVTEIDEPSLAVTAARLHAPEGLCHLLGLPHGEDALGETAVLTRLRAVLEDLDACAAALRSQSSGLPVILDNSTR